MFGEVGFKGVHKSIEYGLEKMAKGISSDNLDISYLDKPLSKMIDSKENMETYHSTYEDRFKQTPVNNGYWNGLRGESMFISDNKEMNETYLKPCGLEGISYHNAIPDFSELSKATVEIPNMTNDRNGLNGNFKQADIEAAKIRGCTPREVSDWREAHGYTWHECNDMKTCQKIPKEINAVFGHLGGVGEYNCSLKESDIFDKE